MRRLFSCLFVLGFIFDALAAPVVINAADFGIKADGVSDDGPAIRAMLAEAERVEGAVELRFPENQVIAVKSGTDRYVFNLDRHKDLVIDGRGSEFRLDPKLRFLDAFRCERLNFRNLKVDYLTQPTAPGTIVAIDPEALTIDVKLDWPDYAAKLGGPTKEDGEQAFFGMILLDALYDMTRVRHFFVYGVRDLGKGRVRVKSDHEHIAGLKAKLKLGETRIGLPVPGVAHRHGPGALIRINACVGVTGERVEVWSAPWFAFQLFRNSGKIVMKDVHVRPRPGSGKVLSACRDAFHAKGNRAEMLFEGCVLTGLGDDAFNLATHCSRVRKVISPTEIEILQHFPIQYIPMRAGDTLVVMNPTNNEVVGESRIESIVERPASREPATLETRFMGYAPTLRIRLDAPLFDVQEGMVAWDRETSNPKSTVRDCTIRRSCRFQTNTALMDCDVEAFLMWFYGAELEGPGPEFVSIENSVVKSASLGNSLDYAILISGWEQARLPASYQPDPKTVLLKKVQISKNDIWGKVLVGKALEVEMDGNRYPSPEGKRVSISVSGVFDESIE